MNYDKHTDEELVRHADLAFNALTSTELESELISRLESLLEEKAAGDAALELLEDNDIDLDTTSGIETLKRTLKFAQDFDLDFARELMEETGSRGIDTGEELKARLDLADRIDAASNDVGEALTILTEIFNPATTN